MRPRDTDAYKNPEEGLGRRWGTPDAVTARLVEAMNAWVTCPENRTRRTVNLLRAVEPMTMAQAQAFLNSEQAKLTRITKNLRLAGQ